MEEERGRSFAYRHLMAFSETWTGFPSIISRHSLLATGCVHQTVVPAWAAEGALSPVGQEEAALNTFLFISLMSQGPVFTVSFSKDGELFTSGGADAQVSTPLTGLQDLICVKKALVLLGCLLLATLYVLR